MTGLRLTRRRLLGAVGGIGVGTGGLYAVPPRRLSASLTTYEYALSVHENRPERADEFAALDPSVRGPVERAIEGGYSTDDPAPALLSYFDTPDPDGRPVVHYGGAFYRLSASLPVQVVRLEAADPGPHAEPVTVDELSECMSRDARYTRRPPVQAADRPVRRHHLASAFRDCVDRHPHLELGGEVYRWRITVDDPGAPYAVRAERIPAREVAGVDDGTVARWEALPETVRTTVERVRAEDGSRRTDGLLSGDDTLVTNSLPDAVVDAAERYDYVRRGDTFLSLDLSRTGEWPLSLNVRVVDGEARAFDPAWLVLSLSHEGEAPLVVRTSPPPPFGELWGQHRSGRADLRLWSHAYGELDHAHTFGGRVRDHSLAAHVARQELAPGETATARYGVRRNPGRLSTGEYLVPVTFGVGRPDGETGADRGRFHAVLALTVEPDR